MVVVTNDDPLNAMVTMVGASLGDTAIVAGHRVVDLVDPTVLSFGGTDETVLRDILKVATVYFSQGPPAEI